MKPTSSILRPMAFATAVPRVAILVKSRFDLSTPSLLKATSQHRTQSVFDYLVETLRNTW